MRATVIFVVLALTSIDARAEENVGSTRWLYKVCKQVEQSREGEELSTADKIDALQCKSYMAGAFQGYNWATADKCNLTNATSGDLTKMFLHVYRTMPEGNRDNTAQTSVGMVLDTCFCHDDLELEKVMCPALPPS